MALTKRQFKEWGRQGGLLGGVARAKKLSAKRRSEIAKIAVNAREKKRKDNGHV